MYDELKKKAQKLKEHHWEYSGKLENDEGKATTFTKLLQAEYQRFEGAWSNFVADCENKGWDYTIHYPKPILPTETTQVVTTGEWQPLTLNEE